MSDHRSSSLLPAWPSRPAPWQGLAVATAFAGAYLLFGYVQFYHWLITNGLLFALLWWTPRRWWPWLFAATIAARLLAGGLILVHGSVAPTAGGVFGIWRDWLQLVLGNLLEPFLVASGVLLLQRWGDRPGCMVDTPTIARLHLAAAVSAAAVTCKDVLYVLHDGMIASVTRNVIHDAVPIGGQGAWERLLWFALKNFMGSFIGIILMAPLAYWLATPAPAGGSRSILHGGQRLALPAALLFLLLGVMVRDVALAELLRLLLLAVVVVAALRDGWRGAALAVLAVSVAVAVDDHARLSTADPIQLQMFVAITGALGLMFGAAVDDLRRQHLELAQERTRADVLSGELAKAARGQLRVEERERRRIAGELHDELGQTLTALQTHLRLAHDDFHRAGRSQVMDQLAELTRQMRHGIGSALERLRPVALDELGLYAAIDRGSVRRLAEYAGLGFEVALAGDARLLEALEDSDRVAAFRLVQEAVTNCVRHARARRCSVRMRVERRHGVVCLFLDVRDDGIGGASHAQRGSGLALMRDRVTALGGRLHFRDMNPGFRVHALLRSEDFAG